ncbi:hypothetical protein GIB67_041563, partial [Kingdonia uniflora]
MPFMHRVMIYKPSCPMYYTYNFCFFYWYSSSQLSSHVTNSSITRIIFHRIVIWCRWVEIMAPIFSREAWRCTWYMIQYMGVVIPNAYGSCAIHNIFFITFQFEVHFWSAFALTGYLFFSQNDLIYAWGVDMQLGYFVQ